MKRQEQYVEMLEEALSRYLPGGDQLQQELFSSMEYSLLSGGKRIRPILTLEFCRLCGGSLTAALPFACAIEMIHTYSLIHDDLPCMDDDELRRGRPTNHRVYGEATALLAGDALLTLAFETMLSPQTIRTAGAVKTATAAGVLARAAGATGMVGGQIIDLASEGKKIPLSTLRVMDERKTGALILAAAEMGCVLGGAGNEQIRAAREYAKALGLAFQIVDDILDVTGDSTLLGKNVGVDDLNDKSTYVSLMGLDGAKKAVRELTDEAVTTLAKFDGDTAYLADLARELAVRKN